jgi:diguanylate cyclase (GGDEF)-like protein
MIHILRSSRSLAQVLVWPYVVLILVLSLLVGFLSYNAGRQVVASVTERMLLETAERVGLAINRHIYGAAAVLEAAFPRGLTASDSVDTDLEQMKARFWIATSLHLDPNNYVYYGNEAGQFVGLYRQTMNDAELRVKYPQNPYRSAYHFYSINGPLSEAVNAETNFDPRTRPWYAAGKQSKDDLWSDIYLNFWEKDLVITRLRQVPAKNGELQGVVATDVSLTALSDFIKNIHVSPRSVAFIMEPNGNLIASSEGDIIASDKEGQAGRINAINSDSAVIRDAYRVLQQRIAQSRISDTDESTFSFEGQDGERVHGAYSWVQDNAGLIWITVVAVPADDFLGTLNRNARWTMLIGGLGIVIALLIGLSIVNWVVRDIRRLSKAISRIGKGQTNVTLKIERRDEIGQLAMSFMDMQKELSTDKLTGVTSRSALLRGLDALAQQGNALKNDPSAVFTVLFLDLNRFKAINDKLGHKYGDLTLIEVGQRLKQAVREQDVVARYGGDEFVIVLVGVANAGFTETISDVIQTLLAEPLVCLTDVPGAQGMTVGTAIGVAYFPEDGRDCETLLKLADQNMYANKGTTTSRG